MQHCATDHFLIGLKVLGRGGLKFEAGVEISRLTSRSVDFMFLLKARRTNSSARQGWFVSCLATHFSKKKKRENKKNTTIANKTSWTLTDMFSVQKCCGANPAPNFCFYCIKDDSVNSSLYLHNGWKTQPQDQDIWPSWKSRLVFSRHSAGRGREKAFANIVNSITALHFCIAHCTPPCYKMQTRRKNAQ